MNLTPLKPTDSRLRQVCAPVKRAQLRTKAFQQQIDQLLDFVYGNNQKGDAKTKLGPTTVGLSANQVGIMKRISIVDLAIGHKSFSDIHVLINPEIIKHSTAMSQQSEGCVNLPEIWGPIERYRWVTVRALDRSGNELTFKLTGWPAILLQHEIDHLNGRLFIDHLPNPAKAHKVTPARHKDYNKKTFQDWTHFIDVTDLVKK